MFCRPKNVWNIFKIWMNGGKVHYCLKHLYGCFAMTLGHHWNL